MQIRQKPQPSKHFPFSLWPESRSGMNVRRRALSVSATPSLGKRLQLPCGVPSTIRDPHLPILHRQGIDLSATFNTMEGALSPACRLTVAWRYQVTVAIALAAVGG
jgi:hypothetical protein